jgi:hypothetical protein
LFVAVAHESAEEWQKGTIPLGAAGDVLFLATWTIAFFSMSDASVIGSSTCCLRSLVACRPDPGKSYTPYGFVFLDILFDAGIKTMMTSTVSL